MGGSAGPLRKPSRAMDGQASTGGAERKNFRRSWCDRSGACVTQSERRAVDLHQASSSISHISAPNQRPDTTRVHAPRTLQVAVCSAPVIQPTVARARPNTTTTNNNNKGERES